MAAGHRTLTERLLQWADDFVSVFIPPLCEVCGAVLTHGETVMCLRCRTAMPRTRQHLDDFNELHRRLGTHAPVDRAASYFYYQRGDVYTRLIHAAKYKSRPRVSFHLGECFARELMADGFFDGIDLLLPVPLHPSKLRRRGYNQTEVAARGISSATSIPVADNLVALRPHVSQTGLTPVERMANADGVYGVVRPTELDGRHLLVIDDVITTGSTLAACLERLHAAAPSATLSVLTLGLTRHP